MSQSGAQGGQNGMSRFALTMFFVISGCGTTELTRDPDASVPQVDAGPLPADAGHPVADGGSLLPRDFTAFEARLGRGFFQAPCPLDDGGFSFESRWHFEARSRVLSWTVCDDASPLRSGSTTLSETRWGALRQVLDGLTVNDAGVCGADKPLMRMTVESPAGTLAFKDAFYGCQPEAGVTFVDGLDPVFEWLEARSMVPFVGADLTSLDAWRDAGLSMERCARNDGAPVQTSHWSVDFDAGSMSWSVCRFSDGRPLEEGQHLLTAEERISLRETLEGVVPMAQPRCLLDDSVRGLQIQGPGGVRLMSDCVVGPGVLTADGLEPVLGWLADHSR